MSEYASFDVDPQLSNVENCRRNVRENADIFVLIIGGKRGSVDEAAQKSIVNLEYDAAVEQGLDLYVFVDQAVLALLPVWKNNPLASYVPVVDSNEVLSFVDRIRGKQRWTYSFTKEADIVDILATQLSGQLKSLLAEKRAGTLNLYDLFRHESQTARTLVQTRSPFWEHLLSAEILERRCAQRRREYLEVIAGRVLGSHQKLKGRAYLDWVSNKFLELQCSLEKAKFVMEHNIVESWGPLGQPGNPGEILAAAEEMDRALAALVSLESDIFRTHGPDAADPVRQALLGMSDDIFTPIERMPALLRGCVEQARNHSAADGPLVLNANVRFDFSRSDSFHEAMAEMESKMMPEDWN